MEPRFNLHIPGWKSKEDLARAIGVVRGLPAGATVVEVGACAGRVTWHLAQNAPGTTVFAVDLWDHDLMFVGKGFRLDCTQENTVEYFERFTGDCPNVRAVRGDSLRVPWELPVDVAFVDPDLGFGNSDNLFEHLARWAGFLRPGGLIAGYNYDERRPDVIAAVERLSAALGAPVRREAGSSFWRVEKPA